VGSSNWAALAACLATKKHLVEMRYWQDWRDDGIGM